MTTRTLDLDTLVLANGGHETPDHGMCVMEAVAYIANEDFTDHPECVSPVIGDFCRSWNDAMNDVDRQMLKPYIPKLIGTNTGKADDETRAWLATDWLARVCTPAWLRLAGLEEHARALESLARIVDPLTAEAAQPALDRARAASAAARDAARDAASAAASAAARDAAWDAASAAATNRLAPVVADLQRAALVLLDDMIAVSKPEAIAA